MTDVAFPLGRLDEIQDRPNDFRLIERVPLTRMQGAMPVQVTDPIGDEIPVVVLDVETTGFDKKADEVIELGLVELQVSPSQNRVTQVSRVGSYYRDPGFPVPEMITQITGIDDAKVAGQDLDTQVIASWFANDPLVVAHSAAFDRSFFHKTVQGFDRLRWACSAKGIPWAELGFEGQKLEYLLLKLGYFYEGHRASIDCLAVAWMFIVYPEALAHLLAGAGRAEHHIQAVGAPFEVKDNLKARGYRWNPDAKVWHTTVLDEGLDEEKAFLAALYPRGDERSRITALDARTRFLEA